MSKINRLALSLSVIGAFVVGVSSSAYAGVANSNMAASATVSNTCTINAGALSFPAYDPTLNTVLNGTATLTVTCTNGAATTIDLGQGANPGTGSTAAAPLRQLKYTDAGSVAHYVNYQLYSDTAHTAVWATGATHNVTYTGTGSASTVTVYGQIAANQTGSPAGTYSDTIGATINF